MLYFQEKRNNSNTNDNDNDNDNGSGNEMLIMRSQKTVMTVMVHAVYLLQIDAFHSFSGTYFFSISGEKLNTPSDAQVVLMPHRPPLSFFAQTIKH